MAAPSKKLYIGVLVVFLLFIPAGLLLYRYGPAMVEAWRWRKLGGPMAARGRFAGCVVSSGYGSESLLLDASGKVLRRWPTPRGCWAVAALDNGNILFGGGGKVWELDRDGQEVWRLPGAVKLGSVSDLQRLANRNTLVTDSGDSLVIELTPAGKEVWRYKCANNPRSAQQLANGNTLISLWNMGAFEVTPAGEAIWKYKVVNCSSAQRLSNGNTLLANASEGWVIEVDQSGQVVWEHKCQWPRGAERLPDGRTLISGSRSPPPSSIWPPPVRILLVSPDGKEEVIYKGLGGRACAVYEGR